MTVDSGLTSPPLKLPQLCSLETSVSEPTPPRKHGSVDLGSTKKIPAAKYLTKESTPPVAQPTLSLAGASRFPLRRRSGDFSLPVRYKYVVIPGNNSRAVLAAFRRRPWWGPARKEDDISTATVVRSSFVSRRKKGWKKGARIGAGINIGYSNKTFNLWWEMYASKSVIESTNLDANLRQAVNHFEFNDALVSKKGLWQSLRAHCATIGVPVTTIVPQTFYLSGGAIKSATDSTAGGVPHKGPKEGATRACGGDDDRADFIAFCATMDARSGAASSTELETSIETSYPPLSESEPIAASHQNSARGPLLPTSSNSMLPTEAAAPGGEGGNEVAAEPCPPETVAPSKRASAIKNYTSVRGSAESFSPDTLERSSFPHPRTLPPSPPLPMNPQPRYSPKTPSSPDGGAENESGSVLVQIGAGPRDVDTNPVENIRIRRTGEVMPDSGVDRCLQRKRGGGGREGEGEGEGVKHTNSPGEGSEGGEPRNGSAGGGGIEPKGVAEGRFRSEEHPSGVIRPEAVTESGLSPTRIEPGGAARGTPTWVVKPAANSNCGFGIQVCCSLKEVLNVVDDAENRAGRCGWVVQRYIERPLLVRGRKFDIRLFVLLVADPSTRSWRRRSNSLRKAQGGSSSLDESAQETLVDGRIARLATGRGAKNGEELPSKGEGREGMDVAPVSGIDGGALQPPPCPLRAWCHQDAYVRMSSVRYSNDPTKVKDRFIHLTNNAVQRRSPSFGLDEPGNKLTLADLQEWLDGDGSGRKGKARGWVEETLRPRMHALVATSVAAAASAGINKRGRPYAFELLGYDFMVDDDLSVWLIEESDLDNELGAKKFLIDVGGAMSQVNSNPCLEFVCPLLQGMIVRVIDDTLSIALDSVFRPPERHRTAAAEGLDGGDSETPGVGFSRVYPVV